MSCPHALHLQMIAEVVEAPPVLIVWGLNPDAPEHDCLAGEIRDVDGVSRVISDGDCDEDATFVVAIPTSGGEVATGRLCTRHLSLFMLHTDELLEHR